MALLAFKDHLCNRRIKGQRCTTKAKDFCQIHTQENCVVCKRQALYECRTCDAPLCGSCQHHDSFGH